MPTILAATWEEDVAIEVDEDMVDEVSSAQPRKISVKGADALQKQIKS